MNLSFEIPSTALSGALTGLIVSVICVIVIGVFSSMARSFMSFGMSAEDLIANLAKPVLIYGLIGAVIGFIVGYNSWPWWSVVILMIVFFVVLFFGSQLWQKRRGTY